MKQKAKAAYIPIEEVCDTLGLSRTAVYQALKSNQIPSLQIGKRRIVLREDFEKMVGLTKTEAASELVAFVRELLERPNGGFVLYQDHVRAKSIIAKAEGRK